MYLLILMLSVAFCAVLAVIIGGGAYYVADIIGAFLPIDNPEFFTLIVVIVFAGLMASTGGSNGPDMSVVETRLWDIDTSTNTLSQDLRDIQTAIEELSEKLEGKSSIES